MPRKTESGRGNGPFVKVNCAALNEQILESRRLLAQFFTDLISEGIEAGEFRPSLSPEDAALAIVGFMNGMGLIWIQDQGYFSIKESAENLVDLFLTGLVAS